MNHFTSSSEAASPVANGDLASAVRKVLLAAGMGVALMSAGVVPAQATNVAIKSFQGVWVVDDLLHGGCRGDIQ